MPLGEDAVPVCGDATACLVLFQLLRQRLHVDRVHLCASGPPVHCTGVGDPHVAQNRRQEGWSQSHLQAPSLPPGSTKTEFRAGGVARGQPGGEAGSQEVGPQSGNLQPGSSRRWPGMRAGREDPVDGPVEGREEAPGDSGVGDGEKRRDPSPYVLQRFSPRRSASLKLLEDLVLPQREDSTRETWESRGCLTAELCAPPPQRCPRGRRQAALPCSHPDLRNPSDCSCESKAIQAVSPGPLAANPWLGWPLALDRRQESRALQATPKLVRQEDLPSESSRKREEGTGRWSWTRCPQGEEDREEVTAGTGGPETQGSPAHQHTGCSPGRQEDGCDGAAGVGGAGGQARGGKTSGLCVEGAEDPKEQEPKRVEAPPRGSCGRDPSL